MVMWLIGCSMRSPLLTCLEGLLPTELTNGGTRSEPRRGKPLSNGAEVRRPPSRSERHAAPGR